MKSKYSFVVFFLITYTICVAKINSGLTEAEAYKMLYENQVKSNSEILKTIFYALGGLATAILAVFASNWWFNEKKVKDVAKGIDLQISDAKNAALLEVTERLNEFSIDKINEINITQKKLQEEVTDSLNKFSTGFSTLSDSLKNEMKKENEKIKDLLDAKINELNKFEKQIQEEITVNSSNLNSQLINYTEKLRNENDVRTNNYQKQLDSFNQNYRQQIVNLNENVNIQIESLNKIFKSTTDNLVNEDNRLHRKISRTAFYMWEGRNVFRNALMSQATELELLINSGQIDYTFYLKQFLDTLNKIKTIKQVDKTEIIEILDKIPDDGHDILKNQIKGIVDKLPIENSKE